MGHKTFTIVFITAVQLVARVFLQVIESSVNTDDVLNPLHNSSSSHKLSNSLSCPIKTLHNSSSSHKLSMPNTNSLSCPIKTLHNSAEHYIHPSETFHNYWLQNSAIQAHKASRFRAYENVTDLSAALVREYETLSEALIGGILDETERLDAALLENNETAQLGKSVLDTIVKKYFYFKSKYYFEINRWYYDIVFNMRKYFKDLHKYSPPPLYRRSLVDTLRILDSERDTDIRFNTIGIRLRDRISASMKSLRIRFYYFLNRMMSEQCDVGFRDVILFAMGKQGT